MSKSAVIQKLENQQLKKNIAKFRVGDTVRVHTRIIEGEKERIQVFTGTVIARKGTGAIRNIFCPPRRLRRRDGAGISSS